MDPSEPKTGKADAATCHVESENSGSRASSENTFCIGSDHFSELDPLMDLSALTDEKNGIIEKTVIGVLYRLPVAMMIIENNGKIRYVNRKFINVLGYSLDDIPTTEEWFKVAFPQIGLSCETITQWHDLLNRMFSPARDKEDIELQIQCKNMDLRHFHLSFTDLGHMGVIALQDISVSKDLENQVKYREKQQAAVASIGAQAICADDIDDLMQFTVEKVASTLGVEFCSVLEKLPQGEFLLRWGTGWEDWCIGAVIIPDESYTHTGYTAREKEPVIINDLFTETRFKGHSLLHAHDVTSGITMMIGNAERLFGILAVYSTNTRNFTEDDTLFLQEITNILIETVEMHMTMRQLQLFRELINRSNDLVLIIDGVTGHVKYANEKVFSYLGPEGYSRLQEEPHLSTLIQSVDHGQILERLNVSNAFTSEDVFTSHDNIIYDLEINFTRVDDNERKYILAIARDITRKKTAELELKSYAQQLHDSNKMKDIFTDIISHDLLNPASNIKGFTELLLENETDEQKLWMLSCIASNNEKLINIMETTSIFSRLDSMSSLEFNDIDLLPLCKSSIEMFQHQISQKGLDVVLEIEGPYIAKAHPVIQHAFCNLISNAIKYSSNGERIIVGIEGTNDMWKIIVTDFGEGIADPKKPVIFDRFSRATSGNTVGKGLGLSIVKRIIELHTGNVGVDDNPCGKGSVFWFTVHKGMDQSVFQ
ncbi:ATP-binding protein [Methanomethylovorans sp.]|uniref:ATP-binding protein n=1 Tax=Methanomethylovorans sp. TaxID=2758717 RepID=UPI00351C5001